MSISIKVQESYFFWICNTTTQAIAFKLVYGLHRSQTSDFQISLQNDSFGNLVLRTPRACIFQFLVFAKIFKR